MFKLYAKKLVAMRNYLYLTIILITLIYACSEPCLDLANRICDCEPTANRRNTCKNTFVRNNPVSISEDDEKRCEELLKTCSCDSLKKGDYQACGLSKPAVSE
ncbi:MAG: hypothetical protein N3B13_10810 [Deltaproteobacteria bacterium]|nr:hypothetical protein [Deltaproteobacteria bacterium]